MSDEGNSRPGTAPSETTRLPAGWQWKRVDEVGSVKLGRQRSPQHQSGMFTTPYLRVANVFDGRIDYSDVLEMDFTPSERAIFSLIPGDILLNEGQSLELVGRSAIYEREPSQFCFQNTLIRFRTYPPNDYRFCRAVFSQWLENGRFTTVARQTTSVAHLGADRLASMAFLVPPPSVQRKIARILTTLDNLIEKTEALIAKYQATKQGMMNDLFTRGLDAHGHLRPPQTEAPDLYRQCELGWIPREWVPCELDAVVPYAEYGISVSLDDAEGVPVLRMNNLSHGKVDLRDLKRSKSYNAKQLLLRDKDVLFNRTNSIDHVGRTSIWHKELSEASFASYLVRLLPDCSKLIPEYLVMWLNLPETQIAIRQFATPGVHQVNINPTNLRRTVIALPARLSEQSSICRVVQQQVAEIEEETRYLTKLRLLKTGLMQDLLTGNVRVKVDELEEVADA